MGREEVVRNQRARILAATIESVDELGYGASTVAHVIALAGVSRRAFYEQFSSREDCFLWTCDVVAARARRHAVEGWGRERGWANRLHSACAALLGHIAESPKGPRLLLVEAPGSGPRARERIQLAGLGFEQLLASALRIAPDADAAAPLACRTVVGGVRHLAFRRLLEGRERELGGLTEEVLDWIEAYRAPWPARLSTPAGTAGGVCRQPLGRPRPPAFLSAADRRSRALAAVVELAQRDGYTGITDLQIASRAGLSADAFHRQFVSREACFLAALEELTGEALGWVRSSAQGARSWPESVHCSMSAFLEYLLAHRGPLRLGFVEAFEVGPAITGRITRMIEALTTLVTAGAPPPRHGPAITREAVTGSLWAIISGYIANRRRGRLPGLAEQLAFVVLAPYLGPRAALVEVEAAVRCGRGL